MDEGALNHPDSLRELISSLSTLGIGVIADVDTVAEDGRSVDGYVIKPSNIEINILTKKGCPWFEFSHRFDIRWLFLQSKRLEEINRDNEFRTEEEVRETIASDRIFNLNDVTHEDFLSRANPVWDSLDDPDGLAYNIVARLSVDTNEFVLYQEEDDLIYGFKLLRRLYYNDHFSDQIVNDEIQKTMNFVTPPRRLLTDAYGVFDDTTRDTDISTSGLEPDDDPTYM